MNSYFFFSGMNIHSARLKSEESSSDEGKGVPWFIFYFFCYTVLQLARLCNTLAQHTTTVGRERERESATPSHSIQQLLVERERERESATPSHSIQQLLVEREREKERRARMFVINIFCISFQILIPRNSLKLFIQVERQKLC